jgi:hypothetical protein
MLFTLQLEDLLIQEKTMGRKGVSKRKSSQKRANDKASNGVFSVGRAIGSQPVKLPEADNAVIPPIRGSIKYSSGSRKNSKKR